MCFCEGGSHNEDDTAGKAVQSRSTQVLLGAERLLEWDLAGDPNRKKRKRLQQKQHETAGQKGSITMKTVQQWLRETNTEELIGTFLYENPINLITIEDKNRTVAELLETAKAKLRSLIQYLCALDVTQSKGGIFFASNAIEDGSPEVCAVLSMRNEILECELPQNYAWDFTPWEELMGYGLAETKLTKDHANTVLAQILYVMTFFGMDHETWKEQSAEVEESLEVSRKAVEAGEYKTAEEVFAEFGLPKDEPDEIADELSSKIIRAKMEYNQHCRKREAAKVRQLLENE